MEIRQKCRFRGLPLKTGFVKCPQARFDDAPAVLPLGQSGRFALVDEGQILQLVKPGRVGLTETERPGKTDRNVPD
jgi:hypothetical protein